MTFNDVQNGERLRDNLGRLFSSYELAIMMYKSGQLEEKVYSNIIRNRAEMFAYNIIATASSIDCIKHITKINWEEFSTDEQKNMVHGALNIQLIIKNRNYVEFFRVLRRPTTNYFFACLMLIYIDEMRLHALESLSRGYQFTGFPYSLIKSKLNLPTEADAKSLIRACGF